jgi:hypothetical protein
LIEPSRFLTHGKGFSSRPGLARGGDPGFGLLEKAFLATHHTCHPEALYPPEACEVLPHAAPLFAESALSPRTPWESAHRAVGLSATPDEDFAALYAGRILPEPYQLAPIEKLLSSPRNCLLIANDIGLGKHILLIVPPGLVEQWQKEMCKKFALAFTSIESASLLERVRTLLSEGIKQWIFLNSVITSVRREVKLC